jgi:hypothetical protein
VRRKLEVHYDFVAMIVISFLLSAAFHLYQRHQYNDLLLENTALKWEAQDMEINLLLNRRKLKMCDNLAHSNTLWPRVRIPATSQSQAAHASLSPVPFIR